MRNTDVFDPKENTGPDQFFGSYASFLNNFADRMRSTSHIKNSSVPQNV